MIICPDCTRQFATDEAAIQHRRATHENPTWVRHKERQHIGGILCPICGGAPHASEGKFGLKLECCGLWSWKGKPLVSRETHAARIKAHDAFDALWKSGRMSRGEAYRRLQVETGMSEKDCHIALMTEAQARRVVQIVCSGAMTDARHNKQETAA